MCFSLFKLLFNHKMHNLFVAVVIPWLIQYIYNKHRGRKIIDYWESIKGLSFKTGIPVCRSLRARTADEEYEGRHEDWRWWIPGAVLAEIEKTCLLGYSCTRPGWGHRQTQLSLSNWEALTNLHGSISDVDDDVVEASLLSVRAESSESTFYLLIMIME